MKVSVVSSSIRFAACEGRDPESSDDWRRDSAFQNENEAAWWHDRAERLGDKSMDYMKDALTDLASEDPYGFAINGMVSVGYEVAEIAAEATGLYYDLTRERGGIDPVTGGSVGTSGFTTERGNVDPVTGNDINSSGNRPGR